MTTITSSTPSSKMNPEVKVRWLAALRSGEYEQTEDYLRRLRPGQPDGFCCLGVLCDIYSKEKGIPWSNRLDAGVDAEGKPRPPVQYLEFDGAAGALPLSVQAWSGVSHNGTYDPRMSSLAQLNDGGFTFAGIAEVIERNL